LSDAIITVAMYPLRTKLWWPSTTIVCRSPVIAMLGLFCEAVTAIIVFGILPAHFDGILFSSANDNYLVLSKARYSAGSVIWGNA